MDSVINNTKSPKTNNAPPPPPPPQPSHSSGSSSSSNNNVNNINEVLSPITKSESKNPYPTTFVQTDSSSFKEVVQLLTGSAAAELATVPPPSSTKNHRIPPIKTVSKKQQQQQFKLYERRKSLMNLNPLLPPSAASGFSRTSDDVLSPSSLDFPSLVLSPADALTPTSCDRSATAGGGTGSGYRSGGNEGLDLNVDTMAADEKAIKETGFNFLHPSLANTSRDAEPPLLPLFPVTSPKASST